MGVDEKSASSIIPKLYFIMNCRRLIMMEYDMEKIIGGRGGGPGPLNTTARGDPASPVTATARPLPHKKIATLYWDTWSIFSSKLTQKRPK